MKRLRMGVLRLQAFYMVCEHKVSNKAQVGQHFCLKEAY